MSNLFIVLLLMTVTGAVFYVAGAVFQRIWFRHDARLLRFQMVVTECAFLVPFVYGVYYLRMRLQKRSMTAGGTDNLFYLTPATQAVCAVLGCVWVLLFLGLLAHKVHERIRWVMVFRGNIPEEDAGTEAMFRGICEELGIAGKVSLYRNDSVQIPCLTYAHGFAVVLPLVRYTEKETAVILYHELCHYLNGDFYLKTAGCIVELLHVFNPAAHKLLDRLSMSCEECCDRLACEKGAGAFTRKEYFRTIVSALAEEGKRERYNLFLLAETKGDCERRVQSMKEYRRHGKFKKGTAVLLAACFLGGSSITAMAAGAGVTGVYEKAAADSIFWEEGDMKLERMSDSVSDEELLEEFIEAYDLDPEDVVMVGEDGIEVIGDFINIDWKVPAGKTYMTGNFQKDAGGKTIVTTSGDPTSITYRTGLKDPNNHMRYVEGTGDMSHTFDIAVTGGHCFFVTNMGSEELHVKGSVIK